MQNIIDFITNYKEIFILAVALIGGLVIYGRKKVEKFAVAHIGDIEKEIAKDLKGNEATYAQVIYAKLPKILKAVATAKTIENILVKFLDK